jgi:hypothetical protein
MVASNETKQMLLFLVHVQRHILCAHYLFFDSALSTPEPDRAEKYPSIIVRQTEITLRVFLGGKTLSLSPGRPLGPCVQYLYLFFRLSRKYVNIYSLNSVKAIFIETKRKKKTKSLKSHCQSSRRSLQLWHHISLMINYREIISK